jgi:hypothetical protein
MWLLLWFVLSAILIGATLWSLQILFRQKKAWEQYAKTKNFTYNAGTFMGPAEMSGMIGDYKVSFFTAERPGVDVRTRRYVTAMEINLIDGLVDGGAMGTTEMLPFMQSLDKLHPFKIEERPLQEGHFAFAKSDAVMKAYLTADRIDALENILKTRNADILVLFNDKELVLRVETSDPMQDAVKIDKIVTRLIGLADRLRVSAQERERLTAA